MNYEIPELVVITSAINSIRGELAKLGGSVLETPILNEVISAYEDWEP
jgi:hypothetical protein